MEKWAWCGINKAILTQKKSNVEGLNKVSKSRNNFNRQGEKKGEAY